MTEAASWLYARLILRIPELRQNMLHQGPRGPRRCTEVVKAVLGFGPLGHDGVNSRAQSGVRKVNHIFNHF